ncbi:hypothetical protein BGZ63DRAFT_424958 [Mariannaea sp. PMI_226]|nr:hypothetical protein BGZ63DRAFT_424958 [Mariannaea sp. PMI_226]
MTTPQPVRFETLDSQDPQAIHRIRLLNHWRIPSGSRVLEIGCGQGNCTEVLAEAVGQNGHVDAVDPGDPEYGAPVTLREAQNGISRGKLGSRITWHQAQPVEFLRDHGDEKWDYAVFAHSIWYFDLPDTLATMLKSLKGRVREVLVAEYSLTATEKAAEPHVLAAVARATLEAYNKSSDANIRCLMSPRAIKKICVEQDWNIISEDVVVPETGLLDGHWETGMVKSDEFLKDLDNYVDDPKIAMVLLSSRDAIIDAIERLQGEAVRTMDVWVARFQYT